MTTPERRLGPAGPPGMGAAQDAPAVFRVLGPLEVFCGEMVAITARRQAIVLALLLAADRVVSVDAMTDAVWGGDPPQTARAQVQTAVSVLRRTLAQVGLGGRIIQIGLGYRIETLPGELDLQVFDDLVATGRGALRDQDPHAARDAFRRALALWRGEPFAGMDSDALRARARRIAERRVEVLEECLDTELRLGLHHEVLGEIKALAAEYPLRERPAGQLMTALYRCGRRAESLAVYQTVRRTLVDELGLEPSPALQRLEEAILNGSADLEPSPAAEVRSSTEPLVPRMLPAPAPDFTGREQVLGALRRHLAARRGLRTPRIAVVTGGPGVGKSAVAVQAAHALTVDFPDGQLYARATEGEPDAGDVLGSLLAALGYTGAAVPDSAQGRAALYRSALVQRRALVVVDDLTCESQLQALVPGTPDSALLVTARARLDVTPGTAVFEVCVPDTCGGVGLLAEMVGRARVAGEPSEAIELVELCGALPLALRAASARLRLRPQWTLAELAGRLRDERRRLDELAGPDFDLRAGCDAACARLDAAGARLFRRLGILEAGGFSAWVAAPLLDLDPAAAADVLETLVDAQLVEARRGAGVPPRYTMPELVRLRARERLAAEEPEAERSAALRRLLGAWLGLAAAAAALHGGDPADLPGSAPRWPAGADPVDRPGPDPLAWYEQERGGLMAAVRQAAAADAAQPCWSLALTLAPLAQTQCRFDDWRESHELGLAAARRAGDRLGEAVLLSSLGALDLRERRLDRAAARLGVALDALDRLGERRWAQITRRSLRALDRAGGPAMRPAGTRAGEDAPSTQRRALRPASNTNSNSNSNSALARHRFDLVATRTAASRGPSGSGRAGPYPPDRPARWYPNPFGEP